MQVLEKKNKDQV